MGIQKINKGVKPAGVKPAPVKPTLLAKAETVHQPAPTAVKPKIMPPKNKPVDDPELPAQAAADISAKKPKTVAIAANQKKGLAHLSSEDLEAAAEALLPGMTSTVEDTDDLPWGAKELAVPHQGTEVTATVTKTYKDGSTSEEVEKLGQLILPEPHATVGVNAGITKNLGDYNSVKVSVSLFMPCTPTSDDIDETYNQVKSWVDEKITIISQEIDEQIG